MNPIKDQVRPDWDLLASWVAVVETGGVSEAARRLHVSQAGVSQRIKQLEMLLGTPLLDRSTRPAQPTASGHRLFENANELLARADDMMESVRNVSRAKRMIVRFGCVDSFAASVGPYLVRALSGSSHQIRLLSGNTPVLDELMQGRELDLSVTSCMSHLPGISRSALFSERFCVVLPATNQIKKFGSLLDLSRRLPFLRYSSRSMIGQQIDEYLLRNGDSLERFCEFDTTDPLLSLIASGAGFGLSTPLCIWQSRQFLSNLRVLPLSTFFREGRAYPYVSRTLYLGYRTGELGALPTEVRALIQIAIRKQIAPEITKALALEKDALSVPEDSQ